MKKHYKGLSMLGVALLTLGGAAALTACGPTGGGEGGGTSDGKGPKTKINFWGWGDDTEVQVFRGLVDSYNETNTDNIEIKYTQKPSDSYTSSMEQILSGRKAPEIFYVGDGDFKKWCKLGFLKDITDYVDKGTVELNKMWSESVKRYRYDVKDRTSDPDDPIYALPKDIGPSVLYYNKDALKTAGIKIISAFDDDNDGKVTYEGVEYEARGYDPVNKVFNNKIPMTMTEELEFAKTNTHAYNPKATTDYGYYTEWWFQYVWSTGGDCLGKGDDGKMHWTLGDTTIRKNAKGEPMLSSRQAFEYFVNLSVGKNNGEFKFEHGGVSPKPNTIASTGKVNYFTSGKVASFVGIRAQVPVLRSDAKFDWDVAPLTIADGGKRAGHSGSMGFGIWSKADEKKAQAAYKFMEYLAGPTGQTEQCKTGFNLPNQMDIANSDTFLQPDLKPANAQEFLKAAEYQTCGDWAYLEDSAWIGVWAPTLNGDVLNGVMSVDDFFNRFQADTDKTLDRYFNN